MAILDEGISFTGSLGQLTAYRIKGSDKIIGKSYNNIRKMLEG